MRARPAGLALPPGAIEPPATHSAYLGYPILRHISSGESRLVAQINYTHLATNLYTRKARLSERPAPRELIPRPPELIAYTTDLVSDRTLRSTDRAKAKAKADASAALE